MLIMMCSAGIVHAGVQDIIPYPNEDILSTVSKKAEFYETCEKFGIPYPATVVLTEKATADSLTEEKLGFTGEKKGIAAHAVCLLTRK